jgi:hypothetical protein
VPLILLVVRPLGKAHKDGLQRRRLTDQHGLKPRQVTRRALVHALAQCGHYSVNVGVVTDDVGLVGVNNSRRVDRRV